METGQCLVNGTVMFGHGIPPEAVYLISALTAVTDQLAARQTAETAPLISVQTGAISRPDADVIQPANGTSPPAFAAWVHREQAPTDVEFSLSHGRHNWQICRRQTCTFGQVTWTHTVLQEMWSEL